MINKHKPLLWVMYLAIISSSCRGLGFTPDAPTIASRKAQTDVLGTVQSDLVQSRTETAQPQQSATAPLEVTQETLDSAEPTQTPLPTLPAASIEEMSSGFQNEDSELPTLENEDLNASGSDQPAESPSTDGGVEPEPIEEPTQALEDTVAIDEETIPTVVPTVEPTDTPSETLGEANPTSTTIPQTAEELPTETPAPAPVLPQVEEINGEIVVSIPDVPPHNEANHTVLQAGGGPVKSDTDAVTISYVMYEWSSSTLVESTDEFGGPFELILGDGFVPLALEQAIIGQTVGSRLLVIFPINMEDLPDYFDSADGYVLVVDIVG